MRFDDPQVGAWLNSTQILLDQTFGKPDGEPHSNAKTFAYADGSPEYIDMPDDEFQESHRVRTIRRKALLEGFIERREWAAVFRAST